MNKRARVLAALGVAALAAGLYAWGQDGLEDCGGQVLGQDVPRYRSAQHRTVLGNVPAAARRFTDFAAMSAYVYHDPAECRDNRDQDGISEAEAGELATLIQGGAGRVGWQPMKFPPELGLPNVCRDDIGLVLHAWKRPGAVQDDIAVVFRGTSNAPDWVHGNLWWFTRFVLPDNQYARAGRHMQAILAQAAEQAKREGKQPPRVFTTGHSLGGGLAQHALYRHRHQVLQAVVFAPSPVTGFAVTDATEENMSCSCSAELSGEPRILRVYESGEALSDFRLPHKIFFGPHPYIHEVRFSFKGGIDQINAHNMRDLARNLAAEGAKPETGRPGEPWYASRDASCTAKVQQAQAKACAGKLDASTGQPYGCVSPGSGGRTQ
jgi:dienelactone hydrolase